MALLMEMRAGGVLCVLALPGAGIIRCGAAAFAAGRGDVGIGAGGLVGWPVGAAAAGAEALETAADDGRVDAGGEAWGLGFCGAGVGVFVMVFTSFTSRRCR